ncbi:hypothetical protein BH23BAC3_BH23BAC3_12330 [soil metagenome]
MWSLILLILICLFCCVVVYRRTENTPHLEYLSYSVFLSLSVMLGMMLAESGLLERAVELLFLAVLILTMILLLNTVRILQPDYARQPVVYSYIPLIIFPFYAYFVDTHILSDITFLTLQTTCLIVFAGLSVTYFKSVENGYILFLSLIFFISAFAIYWLSNVETELILSLTHLFSGVGMIAASFKFPAIPNVNKR